jgi:hypothetical protein
VKSLLPQATDRGAYVKLSQRAQSTENAVDLENVVLGKALVVEVSFEWTSDLHLRACPRLLSPRICLEIHGGEAWRVIREDVEEDAQRHVFAWHLYRGRWVEGT